MGIICMCAIGFISRQPLCLPSFWTVANLDSGNLSAICPFFPGWVNPPLKVVYHKFKSDFKSYINFFFRQKRDTRMGNI
jgi:hypothetical protein